MDTRAQQFGARAITTSVRHVHQRLPRLSEPALAEPTLAEPALARFALRSGKPILVEALLLARRRAAIVPGGATACWPLYRVPAAIVPLRPAVVRVAINIPVGAGIHVAVRGAAGTCRVAVAPMRYRPLGAGRGGEPGRAAAGVGAACSVHRLVRSRERA